ncbi:hypothetical protein SHXM_09858 [Streptomyces hygroscopicus]|nr:hypothetical protein SHXM_09858 [Streptomyces hygroscopicus]
MENDKTARPSRRRAGGGRPPATRRLVAGGGQDSPDHMFAAVTRPRTPLEYLAELFTAGDTDVVAGVLMKLTAPASPCLSTTAAPKVSTPAPNGS